jgi:hypothetical protein
MKEFSHDGSTDVAGDSVHATDLPASAGQDDPNFGIAGKQELDPLLSEDPNSNKHKRAVDGSVDDAGSQQKDAFSDRREIASYF